MTELPTLERIDPADAWKPWAPSAADPWGRKWASHLYRRAAFGPSREDLLEAERIGPSATIDLLIAGRPDASERLQYLADIGPVAAARDESGDHLRTWWLYAMLEGGHPLREKLTLFWHNHFATSIVKVRDPEQMFRQNGLLRAHALGRFSALLQAIAKDPAMLVWLDSNSNVKGRPNENFARELMELFSLGVGNYTEGDVREAARAFTGWHADRKGFRFVPTLHDGGTKVVLGQTGKWDGADVIRIVLEQPAAARFLVQKLYQFFVGETAPPSALLEPLCESFRESDYDIQKLIRTVLASRLFYSAHAFRKRIKGPVEYAIGAVRAIYRRYNEGDIAYKPLPPQVLVARLNAMGQSLFAPPNVKGWSGGRSWLNTSTVLARDNFAAELASGGLWAVTSPVSIADSTAAKSDTSQEGADTPIPPLAYDPARLFQEAAASTPADIVRVVIESFVPGGVRPEARAKLMAFLSAGGPVGRALDSRVREMVHAILTMPEYQMA